MDLGSLGNLVKIDHTWGVSNIGNFKVVLGEGVE